MDKARDQRNSLQSPVSLFLFGLLLFLAACVPGTALPTVVPVAFLPTLTVTAVTGPDIPPTFTPNPSGTPLPPGQYQPLPTLAEPTVTGTLPTPTIRPTQTLTPWPTRTPTPAPIPPPNANTPARVIHYNNSRLGLHVILNNDDGIMQFVSSARPAVMKGVGDLGFLRLVKEASPTTVTLGRVDDIYIQNYIGEPEEAAQIYVDKHLRTYQLNPGVDYWEGWNEPDPGTQWMSWYARFEQERVKLMAQHGLRSAIGGFPPGVPEIAEFRLFVPAIETALQYGGILTLHEGDLVTGDMQFMYGSALPGYPFYADRGAMAFRYRWFYREILEPAGLVIPLIISELEFAGWSTTTADNLVYNQLAWYDSEARKDPYVIGFTVFTAGANAHWDHLDLNPVLSDLTHYVNSQN